MDKIILSPIELSELLDSFRGVIKEEIEAYATLISREGINTPPLTTKELCAYLRVTEPTIIRWKTKGKIPFYNIGTSVRFNLKDVLKALGK
ncbi:MAG: helix-turn-helix domain-containing protein [Chitinophagaceae bacterium]|nr:helix-turn-helix domain-containing protein [Chitinophagaceae bacterium]